MKEGANGTRFPKPETCGRPRLKACLHSLFNHHTRINTLQDD
ncbi:hypothetical protein HMPREF0972_01909 [Actinomyces sp. oral taxon 848 str. F0332]|nr:hypothetical protein HMPREF0972_01909 [Actinomyces sp. oral taxon 848 str. F0332]